MATVWRPPRPPAPLRQRRGERQMMTSHSFAVIIERMYQQNCKPLCLALDSLVSSPPGPPGLPARLPGPSLGGWSPLPGASLPTQCRRRLHWNSPRAGGVVGGGSPCVFARAAGAWGPPCRRPVGPSGSSPPPSPGLVARRLVGVGGPCCPPLWPPPGGVRPGPPLRGSVGLRVPPSGALGPRVRVWCPGGGPRAVWGALGPGALRR